MSYSSALLISVGIFLGSFPLDALAAGIGTTSSKLFIPRIGINRSSKDNGGSISYTGAEYATHRPYKIDFDLLQASDRSHELEMPLLRNNDILDESKDSDFILAMDPTLRSRRRRRRQVENQQVISASSPEFQRFNLCLPYFNTNPMCRQIILGMTNSNNNNSPANIYSNLVQNHAHGHGHHPSALTVPSSASNAFYVPSAFPPSSISSLSHSNTPIVAGGSINRNDLAILNYYQQQQFPPQQQQSPFQQLGAFQGPIPVQRQRPQYDNIHTKYPYPYPPTDVQQPIQVVVPESGNSPTENVESSNGGVSTDPTAPPPSVPPPSQTVPPEVSQTTLVPEASVADQQQVGGQQQDPAAPAPVANFPDSPHQQGPQEPAVEPIQTTTYNPSGMSSSPLPPSAPVPTSPPSQEQSASQGGGLPASPGHQNDPGSFQQQPPLPIQIPQAVQHIPDHAMQKRLREQEEENRRLKSQLDQANLQVASYEQENNMFKDQVLRSEEANIKLRDRVLQLENTNQHLQEQNGQLQQVTAEQRQQINGLKASVKDAKDQLDNYQNQVTPLTQEVQNHRKEIEDFVIKIRKLGEENETCKKQVRLYQLKVNYIIDQHRAQQEKQQQQLQQQGLQQQQQPAQIVHHQKKKQPSSAKVPQKQPQLPSTADLVTVHVDDDELDPELARMDAEIAALQKNADEVAAAIQNLPQPQIPPQQPENISSPVAAVAIPESAIPPVVVKKENEFPGEAVQVDPQQTKHKQGADAAPVESASRTIPPGSAPAWEKPAGF